MYCSHWKTGANTSSKHYYHIDLHRSREIDFDIFAAFQLGSGLHIHASSCIQFIKFLLMITVLSTSLQNLQPTGHNLAPTHESSFAYIRHKIFFVTCFCLHTLRYTVRRRHFVVCVFLQQDQHHEDQTRLPVQQIWLLQWLLWVPASGPRDSRQVSEVSLPKNLRSPTNENASFCCVTELSGCHSLPLEFEFVALLREQFFKLCSLVFLVWFSVSYFPVNPHARNMIMFRINRSTFCFSSYKKHLRGTIFHFQIRNCF